MNKYGPVDLGLPELFDVYIADEVADLARRVLPFVKTCQWRLTFEFEEAKEIVALIAELEQIVKEGK